MRVLKFYQVQIYYDYFSSVVSFFIFFIIRHFRSRLQYVLPASWPHFSIVVSTESDVVSVVTLTRTITLLAVLNHTNCNLNSEMTKHHPSLTYVDICLCGVNRLNSSKDFFLKRNQYVLCRVQQIQDRCKDAKICYCMMSLISLICIMSQTSSVMNVCFVFQ